MSTEGLPPKKKTEEDNIDSWLMSYADMITLLMGFFVIFVATSEPKEDMLAAATSGLRGTFGTLEMATPFEGTMHTIEGIIAENEAYRYISAKQLSKGIELEITSDILFKKNLALLNPAHQKILDDLLLSLKGDDYMDYRITVEGHTDDSEPESGLYKNSWELSAARAATIVSVLQKQGFAADRLHAEAYGATHPKVPNRDAEGAPIPINQERNRRIVLRMSREG